MGDIHLPSREGLTRPRYTATIISPADEMILASDMMQIQIRSNSVSQSLPTGQCITVHLKLDQLELEIKGGGNIICELDKNGFASMNAQLSSLVSASDGYAYGTVLNGPHELVVTVNYGEVEQHKTSSAFYLLQEEVQVGTNDAMNSFSDAKRPADGLGRGDKSETVQDQHQHQQQTSRSDSESLAVPSDNVILLKKGLEIVYPAPESEASQELLQMRIAVPYILLQFEGLKLELVFDDARFDLTDVMWAKIELDSTIMSRAASFALDRTHALGCNSRNTMNINGDTAVDGGSGIATSSTTTQCSEAAHSMSRWWSAYGERATFAFDVGGLDMGAHTVQIVASTSSYAVRNSVLPNGGGGAKTGGGASGEQRVEASSATEDQKNKNVFKVLEFDAIRVFRTK